MPDIRSAIAHTYVEPRGAGRAMVARIAGGEVLGAVGATLAGMAARTPDESPVKAGRIGFLAVFPDEVVLFAGKRGAFKPKPSDEVILSLPRAAVSSASLEKKAVKGVLTLSLSDGDKWEFDMPRVHLKAAEKVTQALS